MKSLTVSYCFVLALIISACKQTPLQPTDIPLPSSTSTLPSPTIAPSETPVPSETPIPPTQTPSPQPILLRRPCGRDYVVKANYPLQIFYGGWCVAGKELADQWATNLTIDLSIDGQPTVGELQLPEQNLPLNCRPNLNEDQYWLYSIVIIPGLSTGNHHVSVVYNALRALPDGSGLVYGPGLMFENTFIIIAE